LGHYDHNTCAGARRLTSDAVIRKTSDGHPAVRHARRASRYAGAA
jgi:hypothetical protein